MVKLKLKRSNRVSPPTIHAAATQSTDFESIATTPAPLKTQNRSKLPTSAINLESLVNYTEHRDEQEIVQTVPKKKTKETAPEDEDLHTESMILALRTKLGLKACCIDDAHLACADDDVVVECQEAKVEKPQQHEKIVMQIDGSLAFLTFSRYAMVEGPTHLLIKVRAVTFTPEDAKKCGGIGLTQAMLPYVPGQVVMGTIEDVGDDVDDVFAIGDRVIGMVEGGGCSRFLSAEAENFIRAPSNLGHSTALALMQDWMPAYRGLHMAKNSLNNANLFGLNVLITDAMLPAGQAVVALASEEGANVFCCAQKKYHSYLQSLGSRITCVGAKPGQWLPALKGQINVVIDNSCIDDYVSSADVLQRDKGVVIALPYVTFDDNRLFGLFDIGSLQKQMKTATANYTMCKLITVDTREEFKLHNEDDNSDERRMNFVRDFQYLAYLHDRGIITPKISENVSLQEVSRTHDKFKSGIVGNEGGTVVCFPWKSDGDIISS
ncbi:hypothetical protein ACHAWT_003672 [Skeletonema menzelii]